jgi:nucleoside phosphorylase
MADPLSSPYGSPVGVFGNPSPFSSPILEQSTPRGSISSYTPTLLPEPADEGDPIIGTPPRSSVTASRSRSASQVRGISRSRSNSLIRTETNTRTCEDYTVGWICALSVEMAAAIAMLDDRHPRLPQDWRDKNAYEIGRIGDHNVVITCLPAGMTGNNSSASVATRMAYSFPNISIRLMVGIGGGVPSAVDVRLGDVVVSKPGLNDGGVVQYDFGKTTSGGIFEKTGSLPPPPPALLSAISRLAAIHGNFGSEIPEFLKAFDSEFLKTAHQYPGPSQDVLFLASYDHVDRFAFDCSACDHTQVQPRPQRGTDPVVHYGTIASGNQVMRDARTRDELGKKYGVLCFDMEAAGLMNTFPCIVIRGLCDYADTHKNKMWQGYAAATAACYAKELLLSIPPSQGHERRGSAVGLGFLGGWGGSQSAQWNTNPSSL